MQKRVAPDSFARRAAARTSSSDKSGCVGTSVAKRMLWGQYAQSSGHAPVLIESSVDTWTAFGSKCARCTDCAL